MLPLASFAVQLTAVEPTAKPLPEAGEHVTVGAGSTVSVAAGAVYVTVVEAPVACTVTSACAASVGAVVSETTTWKTSVPVLPLASFAVQVTDVEPAGKPVPEAGEHVTVGAGSTASVAVGAVYVTVVDGPVAGAVTSACAAIAGAVVSWTTTWNVVTGVALPLASVAVQVTSWAPSASIVPAATEHDTTGLGSTASVAAGRANAAPAAPVASTVTLVGVVNVGGVVSASEAALPSEPVARPSSATTSAMPVPVRSVLI